MIQQVKLTCHYQSVLNVATTTTHTYLYLFTTMQWVYLHGQLPTGVETYWHTYGTTEDKKVATLIQGKLASKTGLRNRGVKQAQFAVLGCKSDAILVEGGFMDGGDYDYITSDKGQKAYAEAVAEGIIEYLGSNVQIVYHLSPSSRGIKLKLKPLLLIMLQGNLSHHSSKDQPTK